MANLNIKFNNKNYSIDSALLADALVSLEGHLTAMVDEPGEPELGSTIIWNSLGVMGNPSVEFYAPFVKVYECIPSSLLDGGSLSMNIGGEIQTMPLAILEQTEEYCFIGEFDDTAAWVDPIMVIVLADGTDIDGAIFPEAGLYAPNYGAMGYDVDFTLTLNNPDAPEERLEGDGAEYYTLAPTALSFRSTAPLNELQEIQINGVTVDPSNYTLEEGSTIVTFPIDYLKTLNVGSYEVNVVSDSKAVKGDFNVKAPELNEYGFYYNQPYTAFVSALNDCNVTFFIKNDGTFDSIVFADLNDMTTDGGTYEISGNIITATTSLGVMDLIISDSGMQMYCEALAANFELGNKNIVADNDYMYIYDVTLGGYGVTAIDKMNTSYSPIRTGINGMDTVKLLG